MGEWRSFVFGFLLFGVSASISVFLMRRLFIAAASDTDTSPRRNRSFFYTLFLPLKFGMVIFLLYLAIIDWKMDPLSLFGGALSSVVLMVLACSLAHRRLKKN
jgi:hypothetical protein